MPKRGVIRALHGSCQLSLGPIIEEARPKLPFSSVTCHDCHRSWYEIYGLQIEDVWEEVE